MIGSCIWKSLYLRIVIGAVIWHSKSGGVDVEEGRKKALSPSLLQGNKQKYREASEIFSLQVGGLVYGEPANRKAKNFLCCVKIRSTWKFFTVSGREFGLSILMYVARLIALHRHLEPSRRPDSIFLYHTHLYNSISAHLLQRSSYQGGYT